jgi:hypothetical protein
MVLRDALYVKRISVVYVPPLLLDHACEVAYQEGRIEQEFDSGPRKDEASELAG